jgi:hypothetical protein
MKAGDPVEVTWDKLENGKEQTLVSTPGLDRAIDRGSIFL